MEVKIFSASVNPSYDYNLEQIGKMTYDEAVEFFKNDTIGACACYESIVDQSKPNEFRFACDGAFFGDGSDCMFVWVKAF